MSEKEMLAMCDVLAVFNDNERTPCSIYEKKDFDDFSICLNNQYAYGYIWECYELKPIIVMDYGEDNIGRWRKL